jgi:hypothetical protein
MQKPLLFVQETLRFVSVQGLLVIANLPSPGKQLNEVFG